MSHSVFFVTPYFAPIAFSDFDHIIPKFSRSTHDNSITWLQRFQNVAVSFQIMDHQKFLFLQRALYDFAKLYIQSERNIHTYVDLKESFLNVFAPTVSTAHVHDLLRSCKCRNSEIVFQYFLVMRETANCISLVTSLIHYVIPTINDTPQNKSLLYGTSTLGKFK